MLELKFVAAMANSTNVEHLETAKGGKTCTKIKVAPPPKKAAPQGPDEKGKSSSKGSNLASAKNSEGQS